MHLDIKKMKKLSTKALNDGLRFFIDLVSGEKRKAVFRTYFTCPGNVKSFHSLSPLPPRHKVFAVYLFLLFVCRLGALK